MRIYLLIFILVKCVIIQALEISNEYIYSVEKSDENYSNNERSNENRSNENRSSEKHSLESQSSENQSFERPYYEYYSRENDSVEIKSLQNPVIENQFIKKSYSENQFGEKHSVQNRFNKNHYLKNYFTKSHYTENHSIKNPIITKNSRKQHFNKNNPIKIHFVKSHSAKSHSKANNSSANHYIKKNTTTSNYSTKNHSFKIFSTERHSKENYSIDNRFIKNNSLQNNSSHLTRNHSVINASTKNNSIKTKCSTEKDSVDKHTAKILSPKNDSIKTHSITKHSNGNSAPQLRSVNIAKKSIFNADTAQGHPINSPRFYNAKYDKNYPSHEKHPCARECRSGKSLSCYYQFIVQDYKQLGAECNLCLTDPEACKAENCIYGDGTPKDLILINQRYTGPPIEVCEHDEITVDVYNYLLEPTTMHWRGMYMSKTPDMIGVPYVSQYPIRSGEGYRYQFHADRSGTLFYHSHVGWQRGQGAAGRFVIRQPYAVNPHAQLYDYDLTHHNLLIHDTIANDPIPIRPDNILIDGKGRSHANPLPDNASRHRYKRVSVEHGKRYRFRVASNTVFACPIEIAVENHEIYIISLDGNDIKPVRTNSFFLSGGERGDFVLKANRFSGNYWISFKGYEQCARHNLYQGVVLHYKDAPDYAQLSSRILEHMNSAEKIRVNIPSHLIAGDERKALTTANLKSIKPLPWHPNTEFIQSHGIMGEQRDPNGPFYHFNHIKHESPRVKILQWPQLYMENLFCNSTSLKESGRDCQTEMCSCIHVSYLPGFFRNEAILCNTLSDTVSIGLYGNDAHVFGELVLSDADINEVDKDNWQFLEQYIAAVRSTNNHPAPIKDVFRVPAKGCIILRTINKNLGYWTIRSYNEQYAQDGMELIVKVGEYHQMKKSPPKLLMRNNPVRDCQKHVPNYIEHF